GIIGTLLCSAKRKHHFANSPAEEATGEIAGDGIEGSLAIEHAVRHAPLQQRQVVHRTAVALITLEQCRSQVEVAQTITQSCRELFLPLEFTAEQQQAEVRNERKTGRETIDVPIEPVGRFVVPCLAQHTTGQAMYQRSRHELNVSVHVRKESLVESIHIT